MGVDQVILGSTTQNNFYLQQNFQDSHISVWLKGFLTHQLSLGMFKYSQEASKEKRVFHLSNTNLIPESPPTFLVQTPSGIDTGNAIGGRPQLYPQKLTYNLLVQHLNILNYLVLNNIMTRSSKVLPVYFFGFLSSM